MIEEQTIRTCISQLVDVGMAESTTDAVRLLWDCDEERIHRKRLKKHGSVRQDSVRAKRRRGMNMSSKRKYDQVDTCRYTAPTECEETQF